MPHSPPVPVHADFNCTTKVLVVTWDRQVVAQPTAPNNWAVVAQCAIFADRYANVLPGSSLFFDTTLLTVFTGASAGVNRCSYFATPPDIVAHYGGAPAAPFADFPVVVHH